MSVQASSFGGCLLKRAVSCSTLEKWSELMAFGYLKTVSMASVLAMSGIGMASAETPAVGSDLMTMYEHLHTHPELSLKESATSSYLASELEALGFDITTGIGDDWVKDKAERDQGVVRDGVGGYGVVGVFENGEGPTLLIRADMDALPVTERSSSPYPSEVVDETWTGVTNGVMHACGHDVHMTSFIGTARKLIEAKDDWSGTLVMILQPAEELGLGAVAMIEDGLFERFPLPDYNLALHVSAGMPSGKIGYSSGYALANVDSVDIIVKGVGGHGAYPHTTKDPVLVGSHIVAALQSPVSRNIDPQKPAVVTVGSFTAGAKHNIISDEAHLKLTVRSYSDEVRQTLLDGIKRIAINQAASFGAPEPEIRIDSDYTPATYNDPDLSARADKAISEVLGEENVLQLTAVMGGEDFSQYGRTDHDIPSLIFWVGAVEPEIYRKSAGGALSLPSLHSPFFAPDAAAAIETGTQAMTATALDILKKPAE